MLETERWSGGCESPFGEHRAPVSKQAIRICCFLRVVGVYLILKQFVSKEKSFNSQSRVECVDNQVCSPAATKATLD